MELSELVQDFDQLINNTQNLSQLIVRKQPKHWVPLTEDEHGKGIWPLQKACAAYQDFWYQDGQDGRETRSSFGLIAADDDILNAAHIVNQNKDALKKKVNALQKANNSSWLELKGHLNKRHSMIRESLYQVGLARIHLKQTWRHIPIIDDTPYRVGFNWYNSGRSIQKVTVEQAEKALLKMDVSSDHILLQLDLLRKLPSNTPLAKVQTLAPIMRANLFFHQDDQQSRKAMNVSLPILFKANEHGEFPTHNTPEVVAPTSRKRAIRSDRRIEDEPFLPSIRVHRYVTP